jgi:hypothetical protein
VVPIAVAAGAAWVAWRWRGSLASGPLDGPFGYRNATGAFLAQGAIAALMAGASMRRRWPVAIGIGLGVGLGSLAAAASTAAVASLALAPLSLLAVRGAKGARAAIVICGVAFATVLTVTIWLGGLHDPGTVPTGAAALVAEAGVTERRLDLWHEALSLLREHPGGAGVGAFAVESPTARSDPDAMFAHHEFLERGAELGWTGFVLTIGLFVWALLRLFSVPHADVVTVLAAAAIAGLGIHASVDYVLRTPHVVVAAAAVLGTGIAVPRSRGDG